MTALAEDPTATTHVVGNEESKPSPSQYSPLLFLKRNCTSLVLKLSCAVPARTGMLRVTEALVGVVIAIRGSLVS